MIGPQILHTLAAGIAIVFSSAGTAIGQGIAGASTMESLKRQPLGRGQQLRALLVGLALVESGGILALVVSFILLLAGEGTTTWGVGWAQVGMGLSIGIGASVVGVSSSRAVAAAVKAISRQPLFAQKIMGLMLLSQSMIEAPAIFSFIIALLIQVVVTPTLTTYAGIKLCAAGLVMGIGCIGPSIGQSMLAYASCHSVGINRTMYQKLFAFSFLSQAIVETPVIFCMVLSTLLIFHRIPVLCSIDTIVSLCASSLSMGFAAIGTGVATGYVASRSCYQIAENPESYGILFRATLLAQVFIESSAIYGLIIALLLVRMA